MGAVHASPRGKGAGGMRLTSYFQQLLRLRMSGAIPPLHMPEWHMQGIFTFIFAASIFRVSFVCGSTPVYC